MKTITIPPGSIDHHLKTYRESGTTFLLEPGEYITRGAFGFPEHDLCMLAPGCRLLGSGSGLTRICVRSPITEHQGHPTHYYEALTGGARTMRESTSLHLEGFTLELDDSLLPTVGVHLWTSRAAVRDVMVVGVFGSRTHPGPVKEGFGILINNASRETRDGGHVVEDCVVLAADRNWVGENFCTGIYVGCVSRGGVVMMPSVVRRCLVGGDLQSPFHAGYAANAETTFEQCHARSCVRAFFCDTGRVYEVVIDGMVALDVTWALDLRAALVGDSRRFISVRRSTFRFCTFIATTARSMGWVQALLLADETSDVGQTMFHYVDLIDCVFHAPSGGKASKGRFQGNVASVTEMGCRWVGDWQPIVLQGGAQSMEVVS